MYIPYVCKSKNIYAIITLMSKKIFTINPLSICRPYWNCQRLQTTLVRSGKSRAFFAFVQISQKFLFLSRRVRILRIYLFLPPNRNFSSVYNAILIHTLKSKSVPQIQNADTCLTESHARCLPHLI